MNAALAQNTDLMDVRRTSFRGCAEEYASIMSPMFRAAPMATEHGFAEHSAIAWQTDLCVFGYGASNPFARSQSRQESQNGGHLVSVARFLSGTEQGYSGNCVIDRVPGPIYILDHERPLETLNSQFQVQTVYLPKVLLALPENALTKERVIQPHLLNGQLLHTCMSDLYGCLSDGATRLEPALVQRFVALLNVNLGVRPAREDVRAHFREALREQICRYIEGNLDDPELSVSTLLANFGVSRASLFRMFEPQGGVRKYMMRRRVVRAVLDISNTHHIRGGIKQASMRWGFTSTPNFNRSVKAEFGKSPSALYKSQPDWLDSVSTRTRILSQFATRTARAT